MLFVFIFLVCNCNATDRILTLVCKALVPRLMFYVMCFEDSFSQIISLIHDVQLFTSKFNSCCIVNHKVVMLQNIYLSLSKRKITFTHISGYRKRKSIVFLRISTM